MTSEFPTASSKVEAFEHLKKRAERCRQFAEHHTWGRAIPDELAAQDPEQVTLTYAEIDAADGLLKGIVDIYNRKTGSSIGSLSSRDYRVEYSNKSEGVWESIAEEGRVIAMWCEYAIIQVLGLQAAAPTTNIINNTHTVMRDVFNTQNALAVGPNASATARDVQQAASGDAAGVDPLALAAALEILRAEMKKQAVEPEHDIAVAEVARAETAARQGDAKTALHYLKGAGDWAKDVASKATAGVLTEAIKAAAGW